MSQKDFLSQFSNEGKKPDSFKEEVRTPVQKTKKPVNKGLIIGLIFAFIVGAIISYFLFFAPKITVPYFVGSSKSDVAAWVKQNGIDPSGIIFKESYDFDTPKDTILNQDVESGKKVKKNVKMTFELSLGADPDEKIRVPDLLSMSKADIQRWADDNKLSSVRFVSTYSDKIEEGYVIKTNRFNEDEFKRSTSLEITISKGPQPASVIRMEDFVGKMFVEVDSWAKSNKIDLIKTEQYSDTVEAGKVIYQSVAKDKEIKQGDKLSVTVSKGKAIYMPNIYEWTEDDIINYFASNGISTKALKPIYNYEAEGECIEQSPARGTILSSGTRVEYRLSLGKHIYFELETNTLEEYQSLIASANARGANLKLPSSYITEDYSDTVAYGELIDYAKDAWIGNTLFAIVSKGKNLWLVPIEVDGAYYGWNELTGMDEDIARAMILYTGRPNTSFKYDYSDTVEAHKVISAVREDGVALTNNTYLPDDVEVVITISLGVGE